jgi:hypothetical protein
MATRAVDSSLTGEKNSAASHNASNLRLASCGSHPEPLMHLGLVVGTQYGERRMSISALLDRL